MVRLHTRLVDFPPSCESAASQYRVGLIRFESGRVLVVHGGVFECSSRMNGKPSSPVLREGWAPAMAPGHSTVILGQGPFIFRRIIDPLPQQGLADHI